MQNIYIIILAVYFSISIALQVQCVDLFRKRRGSFANRLKRTARYFLITLIWPLAVIYHHCCEYTRKRKQPKRWK